MRNQQFLENTKRKNKRKTLCVNHFKTLWDKRWQVFNIPLMKSTTELLNLSKHCFPGLHYTTILCIISHLVAVWSSFLQYSLFWDFNTNSQTSQIYSFGIFCIPQVFGTVILNFFSILNCLSMIKFLESKFILSPVQFIYVQYNWRILGKD